MKITFIAILCFAFVFCTSCIKIDNDRIVPESLEYSLNLISVTNIEKTTGDFCVTYDSIKKASDVEILRTYNKEEAELKRKKGYSYKAINVDKETDQITFKNSWYKDALSISLIPKKIDINKNGSLDAMFIIEYPDSIVFQAHDYLLSSNIPFLLMKFLREDEHILSFLAVWHNKRTNEDMLIFNKTNRLIWKYKKTPDSLVIINLNKKSKTVFPVGAYFTYLNYQDIYDSILVLPSVASCNGHSYRSMDDEHAYLAAFDDKGTIIWTDTLSDRTRGDINPFVVLNGGQQHIYAFTFKKENNKIENKVILINRSNGQILRQKSTEFPINGYFLYSDSNSIFIYCTEKNHSGIYQIDKLLNIKKIATIETLLGGPLDEAATVSTVDKQNMPIKLDNRDMDIRAILIVNTSNQLVLIDRATFKILACSPHYSKRISYAISNSDNGKVILICSGNLFEEYMLVRTPFLTRLKPHWTFIVSIFFIFIFLPFTYFSVRKILYLLSLLKILSSQSKSQGVIIIRKGFLANNPRIVGINAFANDLLFDKKNNHHSFILKTEISSYKKREFAELPTIIQEQIVRYIDKFDSGVKTIILSGSNEKYLTLSFNQLKLFGINNSLVVTIQDSTGIVKKELYNLTINIVHAAKNELAEIQSKIENVLFQAKENISGDIGWLENSELKLNEGISEIADMLRKLLYASEISTGLVKPCNLKNLVDSWIVDKGTKYQRHNINLINEIDSNAPEIKLDSLHFSFLLQCACDNSMEAMPKDSNKRNIVFSNEMTDGNVNFMITDNGVGMSEEQLHTLSKGSFTTKKSGTGLGLRIIKRISEECDASVTLKSEKNEGTQLIISFKIN